MRALHLYANYKWTGPAELAIQLVHGLQRSDGGCSAELAVAEWTHDGAPHAIRARVEELGLPTRRGLALRRHVRVRPLWRDAKRLASWLDEGRYDVLHAHQPGDHLLAAIAVGLAEKRVPIVRSFWENTVPWPWPRAQFAFSRTRGVLVPFADLAPAISRRFGLPRSAMHVLEPPLAAEFFADAPQPARPDGLPPSGLVLGVTARIQPRRRWELLWQAFARVAGKLDAAHFAVLGRPDEGVFEELCEGPLRELGIRDRVTFLGYRRHGDYLAAVRSFDVFTMVVPGSDATCRALREALALGIPAVTSHLGHFPTIVEDGETGLVRRDEPDHLADGYLQLLEDSVLRARLGARARERAQARWSGLGAGAALLEVYRRIGVRA